MTTDSDHRRDLRVGVMGAGAIGCYLGGALASQGVETVLVGREPVRAEIEEFGLTLTDLDGAVTSVRRDAMRFVTEPVALAATDIVLVAVKSGASATTASLLAGILPRDVIVVSMQNGLHNAEILRADMPGRKVLAGIVGFNVVAKGKGVFRRATTGELVIEGSNDERIATLAQRLRAFALTVALRTDVRALQWSKLTLNLNNALSALSGQPTPHLLFDAAYRRILRAIIAEALAIMRHAGIETARLGPLPVGLFPAVLALPTPLLRAFLKAQLRVDPEARSSMWADLMQGRITEVDELNGEIVRLARSIGRDAPINRRMVELVHEAERRGPGSPEMSADALARALGI
jgi:2-dehydropantoate 2-reductase